jgi:hypothetical protein
MIGTLLLVGAVVVLPTVLVLGLLFVLGSAVAAIADAATSGLVRGNARGPA